jgi:hypothetical protein
MSNCPHCHKELPPPTREDMMLMLEMLKQNKEFMFELGKEAAKTIIGGTK